jgi:rhodanese-related sulfurtransferase
VNVVEVREPDEWEAGHIPGAALIPRGLLECQAAEKLPDEESRIAVRCAR